MASDNGEDDDGVEEFTGFEEEEPAPAAGPSRTKSLYKAPTLAELDELRAAEASGGNTFSLQLDALLSSTLLPSAPSAQLKTLLGAVHDLVHALPALSPLAPPKAVARLAKGSAKGKHEAVPFPAGAELDLAEVQWKLGFEPPAEVFVGGSWAVCGGYKKGKGEAGGVDVVVVMPQAMFSAKDRTAYRYFHKRAHYLAVIYAGLRKAAADSKSPLHGVELAWEHADARRPVIAIRAGKAQGLKHKTVVRVHAAVPADTFPLAQLYPSKSLIRLGDGDDEASPQTAASIVRDTLHKQHLIHLHRLATALGADDRVADKFLALWRIWAARRGLPAAAASGSFAAMLLGWVVDGAEVGGKGGDRAATKRTRGLGKGLGAWGALRAAWELLAHTDFEKTPVFLTGESDARVPKSEWVDAYNDILVDPTGTLNLFGAWEKGDVELLRYFARETLAMLEDSSVDHFADVFLADHTLGPATFDEYIIVDTSNVEDDADAVATAEFPSAIERHARLAADVVRRGLTDRAKLVHTQVLSDSTFAVGLLLNGAAATRVLDMGPVSTDEAGGAAFRQLWGEKADLRRFKDGSIAESVVWTPSRPEEAALIPSQAAAWLIKRHVGDVAVNSISNTPEWLSILQTPASARDAVNTAGAERLGFRPVMDAYDALYKLLKDVDSELPLAVLNVAPASEMLRYATTFIPHPVDTARAASAPSSISYVPVAEVTMQFESSPRWPDDLAALQKLKLALLEKLARVVQSRMRGVKVEIALDANATDIEDAAALEVLLPQGVAFRIRVYHEREKKLLEQALEPPLPGVPRQLPPPPRKLVVPALAKNVRRFQHLPAHHAALAPLHHRFPTFSTAVRLLKRWAAAHMLSSHLQPEALELLVAHRFLEPGALAPPSGATTAFLRTLQLIATWDWRQQPVFIPLVAVTRDAASASGRPRFASDLRAAALAAFEKRRSGETEVVSDAWALVTEADETGTRWTAGIGPVIAGRVAALAAASLNLVSSGAAAGELNVEGLFHTPLEHYDAVFHLYPGTRAAEAVQPDEALWAGRGAFRNLGLEETPLRLSFDPVSLLVRQIKDSYGDALLIFQDVHGGRALGLLWNPTKSQPRAFKPFLGYNSAPTKGKAALVELNRDAVVAEITRLGQGIIERVERR
ncbi:hypothetical protein VHUM_04143 [Vanrija humicola]|uniref:U3 small nucleolar RNA-associated protein 22 n=1 Tax=Vanrija humicola TaxID=5417 RepID=A0A7D8V2F9_VANHU|nr:hypothetical protein VHUM_04143 [Vanrija humicola]